jgi:CheY-like chemotaxis protein
MKWHNAVRDRLPESSGHVLISLRGVYYIAIYNEGSRQFIVPELGSQALAPDEHIYWTVVEEPPAAGQKRILLVDDDPEDQQFMAEGIKRQRADLHIDSVSDGQQALDYLFRRGNFSQLSNPPDVILLDLNLPLVDGFTVLEHINREAHLKHIPVYVVSASRNQQQWNKALSLGARGFYNKGSTLDELTKVMTEICFSIG